MAEAPMRETDSAEVIQMINEADGAVIFAHTKYRGIRIAGTDTKIEQEPPTGGTEVDDLHITFSDGCHYRIVRLPRENDESTEEH